MASDNDGPRHWSAAGPHSAAWSRLGEATRQGFDKAAQGASPVQEAGEAKTGDKARQTHDLEPSASERRTGAALDKAAAQRLFDRHKAVRAPERSRGFDLSR